MGIPAPEDGLFANLLIFAYLYYICVFGKRKGKGKGKGKSEGKSKGKREKVIRDYTVPAHPTKCLNNKAKRVEREAGKRRRRVVQHDRLRRYGAYSDGSSNLLNPYRTPSSQEPAGQVANNALWARRESFDSY